MEANDLRKTHAPNLQKILYNNADLLDSQAFTLLSSLFYQGLFEYPIHIAIAVASELL